MKPKVINLNNPGEDSTEQEFLSPDKLRNYKGLDTLTDEQAEERIQSINALCHLLYELFTKIKSEEYKKAA